MATLTAFTATPLPSRAEARAVTWDGAVLAGFVVLLAWVPFWFGSNSAFAWGINAVVFPGLVVLHELGLRVRGLAHPVGLGRIWVPAAAFGLCILWTGLQLTTWTPAALHHPIWDLAAQALGMPLAGSVTISRDLTALALMRLATTACVFWLALQLGRDPRRARQILLSIAAIGVGYAIYGTVVFFAFPGTILWYDKVIYGDTVTATFVNRNSYATYAGCTVIICFALLLSALQNATHAGSWIVRVARAAVAIVGPAGLSSLAGAIACFALILTASRGGIGATFLALAGTGLLFSVRSRGARASGIILPIVAFGLLCAVLMAAGEVFVSRLEQVGTQSSDRLAVYALTLKSLLASPWSGAGYGTFERAFPMFRDGSLSARDTWDKAHNTHLEVLQGLGLVAGPLLFAVVGWAAARCFRGVLSRRQNVAVPLAAFGATLLVTLHAFVDFSLQIQAVAITWAALLGAGVAQSWSTLSDTSGADLPPGRTSHPASAGQRGSGGGPRRRPASRLR